MGNLLTVKNLKKYFTVTTNTLQSQKTKQLCAVDDVSFSIKKSETLGIVGESGCGKSTLGKTILRLYPKTAGTVLFKNKDIFTSSKTELIKIRKSMQMIFQDPFSSLNPRKNLEQIIEQPLLIHKIGLKKEIAERVHALLADVGLDLSYKRRYPHQFSGGQRQRIGIARALALHPELIVCDEPVSALDVSIQAQIINLLKDLQEKYELTYIFIAHDLSVVEFIADKIIVMYLGKIIESATKKELISHPCHPYTKALFAASPNIDPHSRSNKIILLGDIPSQIDRPSGCHFHPRCPEKIKICEKEYPQPKDVSNSHSVACHRM